MDAALITPFINSTVNVFETMLGCTPQRTDLTITETIQNQHDITGVIGLSGRASGSVVISMEKSVALSAAEAMLAEKCEEVDESVIDVVGELTNMIGGNAKSRLPEYEMNLALPTVITGKEHAIRFASEVSPVLISFTSEWGEFTIEVALKEDPQAATTAKPVVALETA